MGILNNTQHKPAIVTIGIDYCFTLNIRHRNILYIL